MTATVWERFYNIEDDCSQAELREFAGLLVCSYIAFGDPRGWPDFDEICWPAREMLTNNYTVWTAPPSDSEEREPWQQ